MYYLKNVRFTVPHTGEEIYFKNGDVDGYYDILNWQTKEDGAIHFVTVGNYSAVVPGNANMTILNSSIIWNNEEFEVSGTF